MDEKEAEILIDELSKHPGIISPDKDLFMDILTSITVPESTRFYEELPDKQQLFTETEKYHYLSLRRVLRNKNAKNYQLSKSKKRWETIASKLKIYSSDILSRNLRVDGDLIEMMNECEHPFSLLGKIQTYDYENSDKKLFIITKPILIIPGIKDIKKILDWEMENILYEEERGIPLLFIYKKKIKPEKYLLNDFLY